MPNVAVLIPADEALRDILRKACPEVHIQWDAKLTEDSITEVDAIVGNAEPKLLPFAKNLRLLQLNTAGVDVYANPALYAREDVAVCSATGAYGRVISEYMLAATLALEKNLHHYRDSQNAGLWAPLDSVSTIADSRIVVLGAGDIGRQYGAKVKAMGAYVIGVKQTKASLPEFDEVYTVEALDVLLPQADVLAMVLPGTEKTAGILNRERLFSMKKGSYLVNAGRGSAIDQKALFDALESGHLAGAAIDVTSPEPLPGDSPLWHCKNLILTPHSAGGLRARWTRQRILELAAENLRAVLDGKRPEKAVNLQKGY